MKPNDISFKDLFGEYSRRREYLGRTITILNQITITVVFAIWTFLLKDISTTDHNDFFIKIGLASSISSLFLGVRRVYMHFIDNSIVSLYPMLYLLESTIVSRELRDIKIPEKNKRNRENSNDKLNNNEVIKDLPILTSLDFDKISFTSITAKEFGPRGHFAFDISTIILIIIFCLVLLFYGLNNEIINLSFTGRLHIASISVFINLFAISLILVAKYYFDRNKINWPILILS